MSEHVGHERRTDDTRGERPMDERDPRTGDGTDGKGHDHDDRSFLDKVLGREPGQHGGHGAGHQDRGGVGTREREYDTGEVGGVPSPRGHDDHLPQDRGRGDLGPGDEPDDGLRARDAGGTGHRDVRSDEGARTVDLRGGGTDTATPRDTDRDRGRDMGGDTGVDTGGDMGHDTHGAHRTATHGSGVPDERMPGDEGGSGLREAGRHDQQPDRRHDTHDTGRSRAESMGAATQETDSSGHATLVPQDRSAEYLRRWESLKASFVDEPRGAVRDANVLVGEVLDELEALFKRQRSELERDLNNESASTEDLRLALGRYRSFFDRLLTI
ncbi:hypothetical protein LWC33_22970 [Pseudonocardia sp. RS11V-5]|uniref:hypothetical protein n=1 Tax=Pseudonocardia terrae TaxID=2905831 RepID=UPI001E3EBF2D|nr:hypothetical protein [Pseudonocardia terrae]MCE3554304.1 hypothetical protein [Pseudonocardia terrae]